MKTYHDIVSDGGSNILEQVNEQHQRLQARLATVRHVVAIASGKGGVGKSTVTASLASALQRKSYAVGILDADLNGPSMAHMMGVRNHTPHVLESAMTPARSYEGIAVMSMDLFLPADSTPVLWQAPSQQNGYTWRSMVEMSALRELLSDTHWGALDVLLVDLAPGANKLQNLADLLPDLSGAVIVTTPAAVAQMVVSRSITLTTEVAQVPVIGLIENMSSYACPACSHVESVFPGIPGAETLAAEHNIEYLGGIPFDPRIAHSLDNGVPYLSALPDCTASRSITAIAQRLQSYLDL